MLDLPYHACCLILTSPYLRSLLALAHVEIAVQAVDPCSTWFSLACKIVLYDF